MKRLLFITPHLSTGGLPQYLLKKIETLINDFDVYLIEWENVTGDVLVVQREKILKLLRNKLIVLNKQFDVLLQLIADINPHIIHFEEYPETFIPLEILKQIYSNTNYKIVETTHGTLFNPSDKQVKPDKTMFVSGNNMEQYVYLTNDFDVIEYPTTDDDLKSHFQKELGLDKNKIHILNVGLFNDNKNQSEIFEYARLINDNRFVFHFVGNQAHNFKSYWEPLLKTKPLNCVIWGERNDVFKFYKACDLFLFTSKLENKPITLTEALSYNIPILMYNLENYGNYYVNNPNIKFLTSNLFENVQIIKKYFDNNVSLTNKTPEKTNIHSVSVNYKIKAVHLLTDIFAEREKKSIQTLSKLKKYGISYEMFVNEPYTKLPPKETCAFPEIIDMEPGHKLTPAHYGCYLAHKEGLLNAIRGNLYDYILIFECDCGIKITMNEFVDKIYKACEILNTTDVGMFSFVYHHGEFIIEKHNTHFVLNEFIGAHAYMIPKKSYNTFINLYNNTPWNVADLFLANNLKKHGIKIATFDELITFQYPGYSFLEKTVNYEERI